MSQLTADMNMSSIESVRAQIERKLSGNPYMATQNSVKNIVTDMDHHPYTRWYRGVYYYPEPVIMEREAGYRPINNSCYSLSIPPAPTVDPNIPFQAACTTIFPCRPLATNYEEQEERFSKNCIVQYR
jgi:hypothetical protein